MINASYFTTQGYEAMGGDNGGKATEITTEAFDNSEDVAKLRNTMTGMQSKMNAILTQLNPLLPLPAKINALQQILNTIQSNAVTICEITDNTAS